MKTLDRDGIFKALPISWGLQNSQDSQSVALVIEFMITSQLATGGEWDDWTQYEEHRISGFFYIIKRDGTVNTTTVDNLVKAIDWDGNLANMHMGPPQVTCQINVAWSEFKGKERLQVKWINPEDYMPGISTLSEEESAALSKRYGSLLRAAVAEAKKDAMPGPKKPAPAPQKKQNEKDDDLPF